MEDDVITIKIDVVSGQESEGAGNQSNKELKLLKKLRDLPSRRTVWKAKSGDKDVLLKIFYPHPKQVRDTELDWNHSNKLKDLGLRAGAPIFRGQDQDGALVLVYEYIANAQTLEQFVRTQGNRLPILKKLFVLHAQKHEAGCCQTDNHLGNYLLRGEDVYLLDAGSCDFSSDPLTYQRRIGNLAMLIAAIPLSLSGKIGECIDSYVNSCSDGFDTSSLRSDVLNAVPAAIQSRLWQYHKKTRRSCSEFEREDSSREVWLACRSLPPALKKMLKQEPDSFFDSTNLLKDGNTCTVARLEFESRSYVIKRYNKKSWSYRLRHAAMHPRSLKSWTNGHVLNLFCVPSPRNLACLIQKTKGLVERSYLLMENVEGETLDQIDCERITDPGSIIATEFSKRWSELEILQAVHGDMKASNFIVSQEGSLSLIDLDSLEFEKINNTFRKNRKKDMDRFMRNWEGQPLLVEAFSSRFKK